MSFMYGVEKVTASARAGRRFMAAATSYLLAWSPAIMASQLVSTATCLTPSSFAHSSMSSTAIPFHWPVAASLNGCGSATA